MQFILTLSDLAVTFINYYMTEYIKAQNVSFCAELYALLKYH